MSISKSSRNRTSIVRALVLLAALCLLASCSFMTRGRCYIEDSRYFRMKTLFLNTNSLQQIEQSMESEGWSQCERNEFRYRLKKDLKLDELPGTSTPEAELLP